MTARSNGIGTAEPIWTCDLHGIPSCRLCKRPKPVRKARQSMQTKRPLGSRRRELASNYSQDRFLRNIIEIHGESCWLHDHLETGCGGEMVGAHVVPKKHLMDTYPHGAILLGDSVRPYNGEAEIESGAKVITCDAILLDGRNGLPLCDAHHQQAGDTWSGISMFDFPPKVHEFMREFQVEGWAAAIEWKRGSA